jgi:hypothetical protein
VTEKNCPSDDELLAFADADMPPEQLGRIERHLELCSSCAKRVMALHPLIEDVAAPLAGEHLDVAEHVAAVMRRLDAPVPAALRPRRALWLGALGAAAAVAVALALPGRSGDAPTGELTARGGPSAASLSRDVGLQLYVQESGLRALELGDRLPSHAALTAGLRNLGSERAHLLLFAIDARSEVHWIAPEFSAPGTDPQSVPLVPGAGEQLLPSAVAFDDLAPGALRVVAVLSKEPTRVSQVEGLPASELSAEGLMKRFPRAEIRQYALEVGPSPSP